MKKVLLFLGCYFVSTLAYSQVNITSLPATINQDFNTLATSGTTNPWTDNTTLTGWYATRTISPPLTQYRADAGSSTAGALYSFGTGTQSDRALGSIASGTPGNIIYGIRLKNNTTQTITSLQISYTGEQWRSGGRTDNDSLRFSYQIGATVADLTSGTWVSDDDLSFVGPVNSPSGALDGNLAANRVTLTKTLSVSIPAGQEIMLRWFDRDAPGSDHGLGIDDLTITASGALAGPATQLAFVGVPTSGTVNTNLTAFSVEARDANNLLATSFSGNITLAKASGPGNLSGTLTRAASGGIATFNDIQFDAAGTYTLTASSGSLTPATSGNITISAASGPTKLAVTTINPASPTAGQPFSVTVQAQDAANQPANVSAATEISLSATGSTIGGTITGTIPAGQNSVTISGVTLSPAATGVTITATRTSGDNLTAGTSTPFTVQASSPTKLAVTTINPASPTAGQSFSVTVQAQDAANQPANVSAATGISLSATGSTIGGTITGTIPAGQNSVTISGVTLSPAATGVTITATRTSGDNLTAGTSTPFTVQASSPTKLAVTTINPASPTAGQSFSVTVQAQDAANQPANVSAATGISLSATGSTIGGTITGTIPAGQNSVTISGVTLSPAATGVTITATRTSGDNLTAGTSTPFTVQASSPTKLAVTTINPASPTAGQPFSVTVQAQDAANQPANVSAATEISLSATGSTIGGTITGTIPAGQNSVTISGVTLSPAATGVTITATRTSGDNLTAGTSTPFTVQAGFSPIYEPFNGTGVLNAAGWTTHSGTGGQIQFLTTASDVGNSLAYPQLTSPQGNRVRTTRNNSEDVNRGFVNVSSGALYYSALIKFLDTLGTDDNSDAIGDYPLHFGTTSGASVTTFFARLHLRKGTATNTMQLGVANRGAAGTTNPTFGATNLAVGQTHFVVVKYDFASGVASLWINPTTNFGGSEPSGAITNNAGTTTIAQGASICIRQSTGTGNIEIDEIRVGQTWASVTPAPAPATQLAFSSVPTAGTATVPLAPIVVQARRADNSVATNFTGNITLSRATGPGTIGGTLTRAAVNGVATFNDITLSQAGAYTLTASATGLTNATSGNITILARASQLAFVNVPANGTAGAFLPAFRVQARRPDNTVDTSFTSVITIGRVPSEALPDELELQTLSGVLSKAAVRGEATFDSVRVDIVGQVTLTASATGLPTANSSAITIASPATRLRFVDAPTSARQNIIIPTFFVDALRADNARDTTFSGNITVSLIGAGSLTGNATRAATRGRATFDSLRITAAGNFRLVATSGALTADTTASFGVLSVERDLSADVPRNFSLWQNYPNPFNPSTVIVYELPVASDVTLKVYDMLGREVATLTSGRQAAGRYRATFNVQNLSSGVYLYRLQAGNFVETKKMTLVK